MKDVLRELKKLRRRVEDLENGRKSGSAASTSCVSLAESAGSGQSNENAVSRADTGRETQFEQSIAGSPAEDAELYNGNSLSALHDMISHIDKLYDAVKTLLRNLFPDNYILSHSVSGKAANKAAVAKPPFDARLYNILITVIKSKFLNTTSKEITEKVHSVQKYVAKIKTSV